MDQVPESDRCTCEPKVEKNGKQYPPMAVSTNWLSGFISKLMGGGEGKAADGEL